ncbi:MAG: AI-2E family transporter [Thermomicrobiales bacterium]
MVATLVVIGVLLGVWFVVEIRSILLLLVLGIIFGAAIEPLVFRFRRSGLSRSQATLLVYLLLFGTIGVALYFLIPQLINQVQALDEGLPQIFNHLREQALASDNSFINRTGYQTLTRLQEGYSRIRTSPNIGQSQFFEVATSAAGAAFAAISLMIIAFYWMTEKATIKRIVLALFPFSKRTRAHAIWDEIEFRLGGWTRGELTLMAVIGIISGTGYFFIGVQFWLALAILAGLMEVVPFVGPFIGGGAPVLVALADSPQQALIVLIFVLTYQQVEQGYIVPRIMKNSVGMSPLTVVLTILVGSVLYGPVGAILAIPVGAAVQVVINNLTRLQDDRISDELRELEITPLTASGFRSPLGPITTDEKSPGQRPELPPTETIADEKSSRSSASAWFNAATRKSGRP